jgi:hypothetical protein
LQERRVQHAVNNLSSSITQLIIMGEYRHTLFCALQ